MLFSRSCGLIGEGKIAELPRDGKKNLRQSGAGIIMHDHHWKDAFSFMLLLLLAGTQTPYAADDLSPGGTQTMQNHGKEGRSWGQYGEDLLKGLVGDVPITTATVQSFSTLFERHRQELEQLGSTHPDLVYEAIMVAIELLPSLKTIDANGGRLRVKRETHAKASALLGRCELLAGRELAQDLRKAKVLVESRLKEGDEGSLIIDLQD
jgi:hypothetical protein